MTGIHGIVFIITGITVSIISASVGNMVIFFWIGIIFTLYGIIKLLLAKKSKKKPKPQATPKVVHCPRCRSRIYATFRFCPYCGFRFN